MIRCPLDKCRHKKKMRFNELRLHLLNDCTKMTLECSLCKDRFLRPKKDLHDCRRVYIQRLNNIEQQNQDIIQSQNEVIEEKNRLLQKFSESELLMKHGTMQHLQLKEPLQINANSRIGF